MTPPAPVTLVLTDERVAVRALRVTRRSTAVVLVTTAPRAVAPGLARRVRVAGVRRAGDAAERVQAELARDGVVLALCAHARLSDGWEDQAVAAAALLSGALAQRGDVVLAPQEHRGGAAVRVPLVGLEAVQCSCGPAAPGAAAPPRGRGAAPEVVRLSAVLIVKDEEKVLGACLEALAGAVDEVVVYDTGSGDATVAVAEAHDALVVRGHWDDHFGDARNRALAHATGDWVLSVDADEVLRGDVAALRQRLGVETADVLLVPIVNTTWKGAVGGQRFQPPRVFRRTRCRWTGALHEYLVPRDGEPALVLSEHVPAVHLDHSGYQFLAFAEKDKGSRNLAISLAAVRRLEASGDDPTTAWDGYGRSLVAAGRHREALDALRHVLDNPTKRSAVVLSGRAAVACMAALGDFSELDAWLDVMDANGEAGASAKVWRARVAVARGDLAAAGDLVAAAAADHSVDCWGVPYPESDLVAARSTLQLASGDAVGALELLVDHVRAVPDAVALSDVHGVAVRAGADLAALVARLPLAFCQRSAQEAVVMAVADADAWLSALHAHHPAEPMVLAAGSVVAQRGSLERALEWATRVRSAGAAELCPLRALSAQEGRPLRERALALAVLADAVEDPTALDDLVALLSSADEQDVDAVLGALQTSVPGAVERLLRRVPVPA